MVMAYLPFLYHQPGHLEALYPPVWHFMGEQLPQHLTNKSSYLNINMQSYERIKAAIKEYFIFRKTS